MLYWISPFLFLLTLNIIIANGSHSSPRKITSGHCDIKKPTHCTGYLYKRGVLAQILPNLSPLSTVLSQYIILSLAAELCSPVDGSVGATSVLSTGLAANSHILSPDTRWMCRAVLLPLPVLLFSSEFFQSNSFPFVLRLSMSLVLSLSFPHFLSGFCFYRLTDWGMEQVG